MIVRFQTNRSGQTVKTLIGLLLEEQSDKVIHCLPYSICIFLTKYLKVWPLCLNFRKLQQSFLASEIFELYGNNQTDPVQYSRMFKSGRLCKGLALHAYQNNKGTDILWICTSLKN